MRKLGWCLIAEARYGRRVGARGLQGVVGRVPPRGGPDDRCLRYQALSSSLRPLLANRSQVAVAHQFAALFVPQTERERLEAGEQRHRLDRLEKRLRPMTLLQVVVRNPRAQVVDVVETNIARSEERSE